MNSSIRRALSPSARHLGLLIDGKDGRVFIASQLAGARDREAAPELAEAEFAGLDAVLYPGIGRCEELDGLSHARTILVSPFAERMLALQAVFRKGMGWNGSVRAVQPGKAESIAGMTITPHLLSREIPWRLSFEIECAGARALFTGGLPFRAEPELTPNGRIDTLILESRPAEIDVGPREHEIASGLAEIYGKHEELLLVNLTTVNLARFHSVWQFLAASGRRFVIDPYLAEVMVAAIETGFTGIPDPRSDERLVVYTPRPMYVRLKEAGRQDILDKYQLKSAGGLFREIAARPGAHAVLFRQTQVRDLLMRERLPFAGATYIHALHRMYLEQPNPLVRLLDEKQIPRKVFNRGPESDPEVLRKIMERLPGSGEQETVYLRD